MNHQSLSSFIWSVADLCAVTTSSPTMARSSYLLRLLRRLDCVLEATKPKVLAEFAAKTKQKLNPDPFLLRDSGQSFYNTSPMDMGKLMGDHDHIRENLFAYVHPFSPATRDIFERFDFATQTVVDGISQQSRRQFHGRFVSGSLTAVTRGL